MEDTQNEHSETADKISGRTKKSLPNKSSSAKNSENPNENPENKWIGRILILISIAGFITVAIYSLINMEKIANGTIPAISFLIFIVGLVFYFPSLLEEKKGEISTMRVVVLTVVLVFATIYIKLGWVAGSFEEFIIDTSWIYILGLAFGAKAFQKFAENDDKAES